MVILSVFYRILAIGAVAVAFIGAADAQIPQVSNWLHPYAMGGYDPVAFHITRKPVQGEEKYSLNYDGKIWKFANFGNMQAFKDAPEVYRPKFRGCGVLTLAQGYRTEGLARLHFIYKGKLLLFHSNLNRYLFMMDPEKILRLARLNSESVDCGVNSNR